MKKTITAFLLAALITTLTACGQVGATGFGCKTDSEVTSASESVEIKEAVIPAIDVAENDSVLTVGETVAAELITASDISVDTAVYLYLQGSSVQCSGGSVVFADGKLTISSSGTYVLSGTLNDAQICIEAGKNDEIILVLYGVNISCSDAPALYVEKAGVCTVYTVKDTVNTLSDGEAYSGVDEAEADPDACVYSKCDLILDGEGTLYINGNYLDALKGKDDLTVNGGTLYIEAVDDGVTGRDSLTINGGSITVISEGDAFKTTNDTDENSAVMTLNGGELIIKANGDGIDSHGTVYINGGSISGTTGTGSYENQSGGGFGGGFGGFGGWDSNNTSSTEDTVSQKGIKSDTAVIISGGTVSLSCYDDAIHSNGTVTVSGGTLNIASGDDGIHADAEMSITGGNITVTQSYEGLEAAWITIDGGDISVTSSDDGINVSNGTGDEGGMFGRGQTTATETTEATQILTINGGTVYINAGGDGLDSNGSIIQTGGYVTVDGPSDSANGAIDYATGYTITGGTLIAAGATGMAEAPTSAENQAVISVNVNGQAGSVFTLTDASGKEIIGFTSAKSYGNIVVSSPEIQLGETYTYSIDGVSSEIEVTDAITGSSGGFGGFSGFTGGGFDKGNFNKGDFNAEDFNAGDFNGGDFNAEDFNGGDFGGGRGKIPDGEAPAKP